MFAVAFAALAVHAQTLDGQIMTFDNAGNAKKVFFGGEHVYYEVEYKVDGLLSSAPFEIRLTDVGGDYGAIHPNPQYVWTNNPSRGLYRSWVGGGDFHLWPADLAAGTYVISAIFSNTSQVLFTNTIEVKTQGIVVTPEVDTGYPPVYAPGQTIGINVTANFVAPNSNINITIGIANITWINQTLTDFSWYDTWDIPLNITTGQYPIYVNRSHDNVPLGGLPINPYWIDIEYFTFDVNTDKPAYLPGENMIVSYLARSVPDNQIMPIILDWEMEYMDSVTGDWAWQNMSSSASPFNVTLPSNANIGWDIWVNVTAHASYNHTSNTGVWILIGVLNTDITTDKTDYAPGEKIMVSVEAWVADWVDGPVADANVDVLMYDDVGALVSALNLTGLKTDKTGWARGIITVPSGLKVDDGYKLVASTSKFAFSAVDFKVINIRDNWVIDVLNDKTTYVGGENINVDIKIWRNGVLTTPDNIEYWLQFTSGYELPHMNTSAVSVVLVAPSGLAGNANVDVRVTVGGEMRPLETSDTFNVVPMVLTLSATKLNYYAGDTVTFTVLVVGTSAGFAITYDVQDDDLAPVMNGTIVLDTNGMDTFALAIPADTPSPSYTARVIADNGAGYVTSDVVTIDWQADYLLNIDILTGPASTTGSYAPGQTIVVSFQITKMSSELPDIPVVTATIVLVPFIAGTAIAGEVKSFNAMNGEVSITLPKEGTSGNFYFVAVTITEIGQTAFEGITINANEAGWETNVGGMSAADLMLTILVVVVIIMLIYMMMKGGAGAATAAAPKPEAPKEAKQETYQPKSSVKCPSCGSPIEVATSKRPIEVMCPKCGTSQIVN